MQGNPYDGHTLEKQLEQTRRMTKGQVKEVHVDMGYRGHDHKGKETIHVDRRRRGNIGRRLWKRMKHRAAVEPTIGHCKNEHRMERNRLWGEAGDAVNALLSAASMNFGKLLAAFLRLFIRLLFGSNPSPRPLCLSHAA
jgi:IS5 family transposase